MTNLKLNTQSLGFMMGVAVLIGFSLAYYVISNNMLPEKEVEFELFGITEFNETNGSFVAKTTRVRQNLFTEVKEVTLGDKMLCDVSYDKQTSQPISFSCEHPPTTIGSFIDQGASLEKAWSCKGLDPFGGDFFDGDKFSILSFNHDGTYILNHSPKTDSDSIWFLGKTSIHGNWAIGKSSNQIKISPTEVTNDIIKASKSTFKDAPEMLTKRLTLEVIMLSKTELSGLVIRTFGDNEKHTKESRFECETVDSLLDAQLN
jgi:hypothetical protein